MRSLTILLVVAALAGLAFTAPVRAQPLEWLTAHVWQLETLPDEDDFTPSSRYTIEFLSDGEVEIEADCNRASGFWEAEADSTDSGTISVMITFTAVGGCSSPSFEGTFLDLLEEAERFAFEDEETLTLSGDNGEMTFAPATA
jgi:heat shock protein HslJ